MGLWLPAPAGEQRGEGGRAWRQGVQEQAQRWYLGDVPAAAQAGPPQGEEGAEAAEKAAVKGDVRT